MPSPSPIGPVVRPAVINNWRRTVVDRPFHDFGSFDHSRPLPVHRGGAGTRLRHTAAQVERRLNRKTLLVLPGDFTPTAIAPPCIDEAAKYDRKIVVEEGVGGKKNKAREIECSVLGNDKPEASVPGEIVPSKEFYDYDAKYLDEGSQLIIPAKLSKSDTKKVRELAVAAFQAVDCSGLARVDFLMDPKSRKIYLNEINTMPGFTSISMYPKLWGATGLPYSELIDRLIQLGIQRHEEKKRNRYSR